MSWGIRITILYLSFVALILTLAFTCFGQKTELESKDYYARELKYQGEIDASANANNLAEPIHIGLNGRAVTLDLPAGVLNPDLKGSLNLLRPSDASKDRLFALTPDKDGKQVFEDASFVKGVYRVQLSFTSGGKNYYKEEIIFLP